MTRRFALPLVLLTACASSSDTAAPTPAPAPAVETVEQSVIYGDDDRLEYYEVREELQAATEAAVTFIDPGNLDERDPDAIRFIGRSLSGGGICDDEPFADQPTASGCSAVLIDDRLVATAGHCVRTTRCPSSLFAFGYYYEDEDELKTITTDDLYGCLRVVTISMGDRGDFAVMEMDRVVTSAAPLEVDASGVETGDGLTLIGFPSAIPAKIAENGAVMAADIGGGVSFTGSVDAFGGNSGSMVLGEDDRVVGILVAGEQDYVDDGGCFRRNFLPQDGHTGGETITSIVTVVETLCEDVGYPSERLCDGEAECGDGWCSGDESLESCEEDCSPPPAPETPDEWTCDPYFYGVGDDCDCACGAYDPDCDNHRLRVLGCHRGQICDENGECAENPEFAHVPDEWECAPWFYEIGDDCDCACGTYDPDCDDPSLRILNCEPGEVCGPGGLCFDPDDLPDPEPDPEPDAGTEDVGDPDAGTDADDATPDDDASDTGDSDEDGSATSSSRRKRGGCAVASAPSVPPALGLLLGAALLGRRRRDR